MSRVQAGIVCLKLINGNTIKISIMNAELDVIVTRMLNETSYTLHFYKNKQIRWIRVIAKKLHHTRKIHSIINGLKWNGFKVPNLSPWINLNRSPKLKRAMNKLKWKSKERWRCLSSCQVLKRILKRYVIFSIFWIVRWKYYKNQNQYLG